MPKYLYQANYTEEGLKGLMNEGGSKRKKAVAKAVESLGGKLEDNATAAAFAAMVAASGGATACTTVLMTPEEVDKATKVTGDYRPPGK
jgi:hypothetical protein